MRIILDIRRAPQRAKYADSINAALVAGLVAAGAKSEDVVAQVFVVTDDAGLPLAAADIPGLRFVAEEEQKGQQASRSSPEAGHGPTPLARKPTGTRCF